MAKGKKGKGKKKKDSEVGPDVLNEVDKTFYELQITDLNRKLARLRSLSTELEAKNLELEQKYVKLDDDRGDVIIYLKRTVQEKQSEISELQERLTAIQEAKESEGEEHNEKILEMENDYKVMREQLTSEVKLLTGKLNALEEFRIQRDELMQKFENQEKNIEEQETRHKRVLYDTEKKFILGKDAIKREMEKQLFELGASFERANNLRIAATTQRAIRENIVINNELNKLIATNERLEKENSELQAKNKDLQRNCELFTNERNKALSDSKIQHGVIDQLTSEHKKLTDTLAEYKVLIDLGKQHERELKDSLKREECLNHKLRLLEQNLHATRCQEVSAKTEIENANTYITRYRTVMLEAVMVIKSAMMIQTQPNLPESEKLYKRESLLSNLLVLLSTAKDEIVLTHSLETVPSASATYAKGDLGFIPKVHTESRPPPMKLNMDSQVGRSFEELLKVQVETISESISESVASPELSEEVEEEELLSSSAKGSIGGEGSEDSLPKVVVAKVSADSSIASEIDQSGAPPSSELEGQYEDIEDMLAAISMGGEDDEYMEG